MKPKTAHSATRALLAIVAATLSTAGAATLVLDDFSQGDFALQADLPSDKLEFISTPLTDRRLTYGSGDGYWYATLADGGGIMTYNVILRTEPTHRRNYVDLSYRRISGGFSILGYGAFSLSIITLVGQGEVMVYQGGIANGIPVPITGTGEMMIPFSKMDTTVALDDFSSLHFRLIAQSSDFSVTLDQIALVPEPGCIALAALGSLTLLRRRRR